MADKKTDLQLMQETIALYRKSPILFIKEMWNLEPQPILPEFKNRVEILIEDGKFDEILPIFFDTYVEGKHLTWQQYLILKAVERAINPISVAKQKLSEIDPHAAKKAPPRRISVRSGHGIGKSTTMSWLLLWFLFCHPEAKVPCTAPSQTQMYDVLWSEAKKWINRMPEPVAKQYDHQTNYIRMVYSPETAFARARTAKKESPEALAGIHADYVMMLIDEASGVPEEIFSTAEGALTEENVLVVMISNPTRLIGYFYASHHDDSDDWQTLHFPTTTCPRVTEAYENRIIKKYGKDSNEYQIRVLGNFPAAESVDDQGYTPLLSKEDINEIPDPSSLNQKTFVGKKILGIDPSGEGIDTTDWVVRDGFRAKIVAREKTSTPKSIARKTAELLATYSIDPEDTYIDSFGEGAKAAVELAKEGYNINAVNVGDQCEDDEDRTLYINKRAMVFSRLKRWAKSGGEFIKNGSWEQLTTIKERRSTGKDRIQIMSKREMRKLGVKSPNAADACSLTFIDDDGTTTTQVDVIPASAASTHNNNKKLINNDINDQEEVSITDQIKLAKYHSQQHSASNKRFSPI